MTIQTLVEDKREIDRVEKLTDHSDPYFFKVGMRCVTKIEVYNENGQMSAVPWIAIFEGEKIVARFDATDCIVFYK